MIVFILAAFLAALPGIKIRPGNPTSPTHTRAICGLSACLILISHALYGYDVFAAFALYPGQVFILDQLVVAPFFFYSGYGVATSAQNKPQYIRRMPGRRIGGVYIRYAAINLLCVIFALFMGIPFTVRQLLLSFIGAGSVLSGRLGACGWYITVILLLYALTYLAYRLFPQKEKAALLMTTVLATELFLFLFVFRFSSQWWNTLLLYPAGMWYARLQRTRGRRIKNRMIFAELLAVSLLALTLCEILYRRGAPLAFIPAPFCLIACLLLLSAYIRVGNRFLSFCGRRALYIYLLQEPVIRVLQYCEDDINPTIFAALPSALQAAFVTPHKLNPYVFTALTALIVFAAAALCREIDVYLQKQLSGGLSHCRKRSKNRSPQTP